MYIQKQELKFKASTSPDVSHYKLVVGNAGQGFQRDLYGVIFSGADAAIQVGITEKTPDAEGYITTDLSQYTELRNLDGKYDLGLVVVDDGNNESSIFVLENEEVDFTVPDAVTEAFMIRS